MQGVKIKNDRKIVFDSSYIHPQSQNKTCYTQYVFFIRRKLQTLSYKFRDKNVNILNSHTIAIFTRTKL